MFFTNDELEIILFFETREVGKSSSRQKHS
jgi:hypothetical protein